MKEYERCDSCGGAFARNELTPLRTSLLCPDCLNRETTLCAHCGERIFWDENAGDSRTPLCQSCSEQHYVVCSHCGRVIQDYDAFYRDEDDDDEPLCHDCYNRYCQNVIRDYYYKPEPIFYGDRPRFFGVELEIDEGGESNDHAAELLNLANRSQDLIYIKHDGSLDDGFEIVTHPMSLTFQLREMPWEQILRSAVELGYTSHQAGTCGLHVHVSRLAFGAAEREQDTAIARVLYFFEKHWEELLKFSRRTQHQLDQWAARYGYKDQPREILEHAKKGYAGRYTAVNLTNRDTIEFRMFRGTLKYNTLIATLQLVDRICDVAVHLSDAELKAMPWTAFVSGCQAPELVQYLKERRLYVNEPVAAEAEV